MMKNRAGFTLVELMIVVVIIGILASFAYPAYVDNTRATKRAAAQSDLLKLANFIERRFTENNSYLIPDGVKDPITPNPSCGTVGGCIPLLDKSIKHNDYKYSFAAAPAAPTQTAFVLQAVPQNDQTADKCGTMTYNQTGTKTATGTGCWR
ncbi:MAG: hypothetical protein A6F71_04320 [Cycloclasticus sp. symbiont of Poecilosclerida sp. M]|nr:MAG: hypothetical protein A6F71_04320 [Cycloclasticus sp. symbiont of Poecilosclerida sp. M]